MCQVKTEEGEEGLQLYGPLVSHHGMDPEEDPLEARRGHGMGTEVTAGQNKTQVCVACLSHGLWLVLINESTQAGFDHSGALVRRYIQGSR